MSELRFELKTCGLKVQCSTELSYTLFKLINKNIYKANKIKNAIIRENNAIASVNANPKIANLNNSSLKEGFLDIPITKAPNTVPIPTPAPAKPIVAKPAPKNFADCNKTIKL